MKKLLFFVCGIVFGFSALVRSESVSRKFPRPDSWVRESVGFSSYIAAVTTNVTLSTQPAIDFLGISVTNPGTSSFIDVYDGRVSTSAAGVVYKGRYDTTSKYEWDRGIAISSGLMIHNAGSPPAGVQIHYREHDYR